MRTELLYNILLLQSKSGKEIDVAVTGTSMEPYLYEGDVVTVKPESLYTVGDVLVFLYKNNELLVHRLLRIENHRYYCKGDNSFRMEDIELQNIVGKVIRVNGKELEKVTNVQLLLSAMVNKVFRKNKYQVDKTKESGVFRFYWQYVRKEEDEMLTYRKNSDMDYVFSDEKSLAVFDPESGDTHFFDEVGIDILNCLEKPLTIGELLDELCMIYEAAPEDIREDLEEFLAECISKRVIIAE